MSDATHSSRRVSTLRQLKALVVVLILSNIALGIFGFYSLRGLDRKYSELIGQAVPTLNDMQTLTAKIMETMRSVNPTFYTESAQSRSELAQRARLALDRERELRSKILHRTWLASDATERIEFQQSGDAFDSGVAPLIPLLESGAKDEAIKQREQIVRPAFDRYIAATTKAADLLETQSMRTSDHLTAQTGSISEIILGFAGWPVLAFVVFLLAVAIIILLIRIFLFDNQEPAT